MGEERKSRFSWYHLLKPCAEKNGDMLQTPGSVNGSKDAGRKEKLSRMFHSSPWIVQGMMFCEGDISNILKSIIFWNRLCLLLIKSILFSLSCPHN